MTDLVEHQSSAPAAISAPADGEPSLETPADLAGGFGETDEPPQPADHAGEGGEGEQKRPSRSQRLQRKVQLLTAELDEMRRQSAPARPQDAGPYHHDAAEPREADFRGDYQAYERALNAWNVEQSAERAFHRIVARERADAQVARTAELNRERIIAHVERVEELKASVPDFDQAMRTAAAIALRDEVAREILGSGKSALVQYYLAKNPEKARALNGLSGRDLARAIGYLESAVRLPAARRATEATPPLAPLRGGAALSFDPARAGMDEYVANFAERRRRRMARA
jgi:hypothetical protein